MTSDILYGSPSDLDPKLLVDGVPIDILFRSRGKKSMSFRLMLLTKRTIDIIAASALLVVLSPALVLAGIIVTATSKGGIFFSGERCGLGGKPFSCFKLRSMYANQEEILRVNKLKSVGEYGTLLIFNSDPRITPVGRWLRKLSIDELPQLWNVVKGDMSLIGPRALAVSMLQEFPD